MSADVGVDIVVVNYKTPGDLQKFLQSLDEHRPTILHSVTVVDVQGTRLSEHQQADQRVDEWVVAADNIGYGRSCNLAGSMGAEPVIACFNADIEVTAGSIDTCVTALLAQRDWGVLGPKQVDTKGRVKHAGIFGTREAPAHRGWNAQDGGQYRDILPAVTVSGSAYFIKRECWNSLTGCREFQALIKAMGEPPASGPFLPTPHYYEETWASYHAAEHGWKVMYYGMVTMIHKWHQASPVGGWAEQQMPKSQRIFRAACDAHGIPRD